MTRDRRPYYAADPAWWPSIIDQLVRPIAIEAVLHDLRYLENEGRRGEVFPSLHDLRVRWGWSKRRTVQALNGDLGDWHDPHNPVPLSTLRQIGRAANRLGVGMSTLTGTQAGTQVGTPKTGETGKSLENGHASGNASGHASGNAAPRKTASEGDTLPTNQINQINQSLDPTDPHVGLVVLADEQAARNKAKRQAALRIYDQWRIHHPRAGEVPDEANRDRICKALIRRAKVIKGKRARYTPIDWTVAERDLCDLMDWYHLAGAAAHWQGRNKANRKYLGISTLLKLNTLADRIADAVAWREDGRVVNDALGTQDFEQEATGAWAHLQTLLRQRSLPDPLHPHVDKALAFQAAIDDVGLTRIRQSNPSNVAVLRVAFAAAYCQARANPQTATTTQNTGDPK